MRVNGTVVGLALAAVVALAPAAARPTPTSDERPPIERRDAFFDAAGVDGDTLVAVGKFGKIVRSEDGGREWSIVPSGVARPLFGVAFPTADHGVIVGAGGTVLVSADRGRTWTPRPIGVDRQLFTVRFVDARRGFIAGEFGTLLATQDAGEHWTRIEIDWEKALPQLVDMLGLVEPHLYDVTFCDATHGWVVGEYGLVFSTEDEGRTWQKRRGGGLFDRHLFAVACGGEGRVVAAGQGGEIVFSPDGGATWEREQSPRALDVYDIVRLNSGELLAVGDLGTVLRSPEGGKTGTWTVADPDDEPGGPHIGRVWVAKAVSIPPNLLVLGEGGIHRLELKRIVGRPGRTSARISGREHAL